MAALHKQNRFGCLDSKCDTHVFKGVQRMFKMHSPKTLTKKTAQIQPTWINEHKQTKLSQQYSWAEECNCPGRKFQRI